MPNFTVVPRCEADRCGFLSVPVPDTIDAVPPDFSRVTTVVPESIQKVSRSGKYPGAGLTNALRDSIRH
ncbi:hypothetical protein [Paraburkholderia sp. 2C]